MRLPVLRYAVCALRDGARAVCGKRGRSRAQVRAYAMSGTGIAYGGMCVVLASRMVPCVWYWHSLCALSVFVLYATRY
eukprot:1801980-Rhodomonas_salina.1